MGNHSSSNQPIDREDLREFMCVCPTPRCTNNTPKQWIHGKENCGGDRMINSNAELYCIRC